jgi:hypothetical protein
VPAAGDLLGSSSVAAAVLAIESLRTELQVAVQLLDLQEGSSEVQQLASVPAGIAVALAVDLAGLPAELLSSPRLERPAPPVSAGRRPKAGLGAAAAALPASPAVSTAADSLTQSPAASARGAASSALSAQVGQMEVHLERLIGNSAEQAARAAAAVELHQQERAARQRAQELAADLSAQLAAVQVGCGTRGRVGRTSRSRAAWSACACVQACAAPDTCSPPDACPPLPLPTT